MFREEKCRRDYDDESEQTRVSFHEQPSLSKIRGRNPLPSSSAAIALTATATLC